MGKESRSFSIDETVDDELRNRPDLNPSAAVNKFLKEYLRGGKGPEAAYAERLRTLDHEIAELESKVEKKKRERNRIQNLIERHQEAIEDQLDTAIEHINNGWDRDNIDSSNEAIQSWAEEAGVGVDRFIQELEGRLS